MREPSPLLRESLPQSSNLTRLHPTCKVGCNEKNRNDSSSPNRDRPQGKPGHGAANAIGHADVAELVNAIARQFLEVVKLADVHALLNQKIAVHRNEADCFLVLAGSPFEAARVG